jgi:hypothetical protein
VRGELIGAMDARLSAYSRVSVQLPSLLAERVPPLALKYAVPANRKELLSRQALWREEMCATATGCESPRLGASLRCARAPPVKPAHALGDATPRRVRSEYAAQKNEDRESLSRQAVQRDYDARHAALLACVTAVQAHAQLHAMRAYALTGDNLAMLDAPDALARLRKVNSPLERLFTVATGRFCRVRGAALTTVVSAEFAELPSQTSIPSFLSPQAAPVTPPQVRLPFERLVRNVWSSGPETKFDASKTSLDKLLEAEVEDRATAQAAVASMRPVGDGARIRVSQTVQKVGAGRRVGERAEGLGLTTFQGSMRTHAPLMQTKAF